MADDRPSLACSLCDADVPVDEDIQAGDMVYCSYCQCPLKVLKRKDGKFKLEAEGDD